MARILPRLPFSPHILTHTRTHGRYPLTPDACNQEIDYQLCRGDVVPCSPSNYETNIGKSLEYQIGPTGLVYPCTRAHTHTHTHTRSHPLRWKNISFTECVVWYVFANPSLPIILCINRSMLKAQNAPRIQPQKSRMRIELYLFSSPPPFYLISLLLHSLCLLFFQTAGRSTDPVTEEPYYGLYQITVYPFEAATFLPMVCLGVGLFCYRNRSLLT